MTMLELEVFRAGDYGAKGQWPEAALEQMAADYDPQRHEAPVTLDHAQAGPAHGWVSGLRRAGDRLVATLCGLSAQVRGLLASGAYKKRSVELYPQFAATGRPYLRAVSLLGAAVPEVKGLADPLVFEEEALAATEVAGATEAGGETEAAAAPEAAAPMPLAFAELAAQLRAAGRWQPAWEQDAAGTPGIAGFYGALAPAQACWFAEFLAQLPPAVALGTLAAPAEQAGAGPALAFIESAPGAPRIAPESLRLHAAACALQQRHPELDYPTALLRAAR